jgi:hypothetical protein
MEKAKRKQSPEIIQKQLTNLLTAIIIFAVILGNFPLTITLFSTYPTNLHLDFLIPALTLLSVLHFRKKVNLTPVHLTLMTLCILMSFLLLYHMLNDYPCSYPILKPIPYTPFSVYQGCMLIFPLF